MFSHETLAIMTKFPYKHLAFSSLNCEVTAHAQTAISPNHSWFTDQVLNKKNYFVQFFQHPAIAESWKLNLGYPLANKIDWRRYQLDYATLSCIGFWSVNYTLDTWPEWWCRLFFLLPRAITSPSFNLIPITGNEIPPSMNHVFKKSSYAKDYTKPRVLQKSSIEDLRLGSKYTFKTLILRNWHIVRQTLRS